MDSVQLWKGVKQIIPIPWKVQGCLTENSSYEISRHLLRGPMSRFSKRYRHMKIIRIEEFQKSALCMWKDFQLIIHRASVNGKNQIRDPIYPRASTYAIFLTSLPLPRRPIVTLIPKSIFNRRHQDWYRKCISARRDGRSRRLHRRQIYVPVELIILVNVAPKGNTRSKAVSCYKTCSKSICLHDSQSSSSIYKN